MIAKWMVAALAIGVASGQARIEFGEIGQPRVFDERIPEILDRLPYLHPGELSDVAAQKMLRASVAGSTQFLRWHLGDPVGAMTLVERDLDILVARWNGGGSSELGHDIWMWDDPVGCYFLVPIAMEGKLDRARFEKLLDALWVWWEKAPDATPDPEPEPPPPPQPLPVVVANPEPGAPPPPPPPPVEPAKPQMPPSHPWYDTRIKEFRFNFLRVPAENGLFGTGSAHVADSPFATDRLGRRQPYVEVFRRDEHNWLVIRLGKPWMQVPDGMYEVAERFPPLRQRMPLWSTDRLVDEFGRDLFADPAGSFDRDLILLEELKKRKLTTHDIHKMADRPLRVAGQRYEMMIDLLIARGKSHEFEPFIRELIEKPESSDQVGRMLVTLLNAPDVDVCDVALPFVVPYGRVTDMALAYLESRGHTREIYEALEKRDVRPEDAARKRQVLSAIAARLQ